MNKVEFIKKYDMKELKESDGFLIDIVYATKNNFTNTKIYDIPICMLRKNTANKLLKANEQLKQYGFKIKIWDTFRPYKYQEKLWNTFPDERFVANPLKTDCNHCKGKAIDITLCTLDGNDVIMPTEFDHFGVESYRNNYTNLDTVTKNNVLLLEDTMKNCGFIPFPFEWWHFDDVDNYDIIYEMYI